jgi:hypothetical protein
LPPLPITLPGGDDDDNENKIRYRASAQEARQYARKISPVQADLPHSIPNSSEMQRDGTDGDDNKLDLDEEQTEEANLAKMGSAVSFFGVDDDPPEADQSVAMAGNQTHGGRSLVLDGSFNVRPTGPGVPSPQSRASDSHSVALHPLHHMLRRAVVNPWFEYTVGALLMLNAISIGIFAQHRSDNPYDDKPEVFEIIELCFGVSFTAELLIRIYVFRCDFFSMKGKAWNIFDFVVVLLQDAEIIMERALKSDNDVTKDLTFLRMLRLGRVVRLLRMVRLIPELKSMVYLIAASMQSFIWTMVLLSLLMYGVAVHFTEVIADHRDRERGNIPAVLEENLSGAWGSLIKSATSLYQAILGGIDWKELMDDLEQISWSATLLFAMYVAFAALVMLNLVTGVFVEGAQRIVAEDRDADLIKHAKKIFNMLDDSDDNEISWEEFLTHLQDPSMNEFFKILGISRTDAKDLFMLLDRDKSGLLTLKEFVNGCLQLRGHAKSLDLARMAHNAQVHGRRLKSIEQMLTSGGFAVGQEESKQDVYQRQGRDSGFCLLPKRRGSTESNETVAVVDPSARNESLKSVRSVA